MNFFKRLLTGARKTLGSVGQDILAFGQRNVQGGVPFSQFSPVQNVGKLPIAPLVQQNQAPQPQVPNQVAGTQALTTTPSAPITPQLPTPTPGVGQDLTSSQL